MCLDTVKKFQVSRKIGYVVMYKNPKTFSANFFGTTYYHKGRWYKSRGPILSDYERGFHIWKNLKAAKEWGGRSVSFGKKTIVTVEFDDVICTGYQNGHRVVVARRRKILGEVD